MSTVRSFEELTIWLMSTVRSFEELTIWPRSERIY